MKLDNFQQFVKDGEYSADLELSQAKVFIQEIDESKRADLMDSIELCVDLSVMVSNAIYNVRLNTDFDYAIKFCVNEAIEEALAEIEEFEEEALDNEPCDIESFKRDRELSQ